MNQPAEPNVVEPIGPPEKRIYAVFCGGIDQFAGQKLANFFTLAANDRVTHIDVMFQSSGGNVGDGFFFHQLFKSLPITLTLYNCGQVASAAVVAFLGAPKRKTTKTGAFMLHSSSNNPLFPSNAARLGSITKSLIMDDERTQAILKQFIKMPEELWIEMSHHNLFINAEDAVTYGLADEIADFGPVMGGPLYNMLP